MMKGSSGLGWTRSGALVKAFLSVKCFGGNGVPGQGLGLAFEQVGEGTGDGAVVGNEPAVEIGESEEPL